MKFTWTVTNECNINIKQCAEWVNEKIQNVFKLHGEYPDEDTMIDYVTDEVLEAVDAEGYRDDEIPQEILTKMCEEVLKYVGYQTIMDLGEE